METLACLAGIATIALFIGAIFGLGWFVISPLGPINRVRVKQPRFQLLDLFWLVLLLQPTLAIFGAMFRHPQGQHPQWIMIFVLIWGGIVAAWYAMTAAMSKADVTSAGKRAAAVLVILPMIGAVIPAAAVAHIGLVMFVANERMPHWGALAVAGFEIVFMVALFGCRRLSRWIAAGVGEKLPLESRSESAE